MAANKNINKANRISFVAGKSGGHILPCLTIASRIVNKNNNYEIIFFSTDNLLDKQLLEKNEQVHYHIPLHFDAIPYNKIYKYPRFIWNFLKVFIKSWRTLKKLRPESIISTGGTIAIPVCLAARLLHIPIELYELNAVPGKSTKLLTPFASKIWVCFASSIQHFPRYKCSVTSYPIKFIDKTKIISQQTALQHFAFSADRKTIVILGGSQGSLFINSIIKKLFEHASELAQTIQIIHQTGAFDTTNWTAWYASLGIPAKVFSYSDAIAECYAAADLIICRSGAGTLAEVEFFDKHCITIPLETKSTMHQVDNALAIAQQRSDLFTVLRQQDIDRDQELLTKSVKQNLQLFV